MRYLFILLLSVFFSVTYAQTETTTSTTASKPETTASAGTSHDESSTAAKKKSSADGKKSDSHRVSKTYKGKRERELARGYRVQIYSSAGGTKAKNAATEMAAKVRKRFPELSVYCRFKSPRWVCRVGDFATKEAAEHYLNKIRIAKISNEASVVIDDVLLAK